MQTLRQIYGDFQKKANVNCNIELCNSYSWIANSFLRISNSFSYISNSYTLVLHYSFHQFTQFVPSDCNFNLAERISESRARSERANCNSRKLQFKRTNCVKRAIRFVNRGNELLVRNVTIYLSYYL